MINTTKLSVTSSDQTYGAGSRSITIYNNGDTDVLIDFDRVTSTNSFLLVVGMTVTIKANFADLHFKTASGTSTLYVISVTMT